MEKDQREALVRTLIGLFTQNEDAKETGRVTAFPLSENDVLVISNDDGKVFLELFTLGTLAGSWNIKPEEGMLLGRMINDHATTILPNPRAYPMI